MRHKNTSPAVRKAATQCLFYNPLADFDVDSAQHIIHQQEAGLGIKSPRQSDTRSLTAADRDTFD
ncbi:hypothetical protein BM221_007988 [Beauveria bassiana]|uniref:Uncharacterized protein n=1 Tax=Beauveria bassiana TaxID=176275 RepID=A0A2N6NEV3_BEABA|nr:hypothetical protein BM221_007988 [Beauveria bassiana]